MSDPHITKTNPTGAVSQCSRKHVHEAHEWQADFGSYFNEWCPGIEGGVPLHVIEEVIAQHYPTVLIENNMPKIWRCAHGDWSISGNGQGTDWTRHVIDILKERQLK